MPIPRRSFLKAAAAVASAAAWHDSIAQASSTAPSPELHVVAAGQDRFGEDRPMGFSRINFKVGASDTNGNLFIVENANLVPGSGPPLHYHLYQDEWFYVTAGKVAIQIGEQKLQLDAGESVFAARHIQHTWSAITAGSTLLGVFTPAGKIEQFFREVAGHPALQADPEFVSQFDMRITGPSPFGKS